MARHPLTAAKVRRDVMMIVASQALKPHTAHEVWLPLVMRHDYGVLDKGAVATACASLADGRALKKRHVEGRSKQRGGMIEYMLPQWPWPEDECGVCGHPASEHALEGPEGRQQLERGEDWSGHVFRSPADVAADQAFRL